MVSFRSIAQGLPVATGDDQETELGSTEAEGTLGVSDDRKSAPPHSSGATSSGGMRMASSGFDLAIVVCGFTAVGWWLDRKYGWSPWGVLTGAILGIVGGLTNFLREARALTRSTPESNRPDRGNGGDAA